MFTKELLIKELKRKSKIVIGKENNISRHKVAEYEKMLGISKDDYTPIYQKENHLRKLMEDFGTTVAVAKELKVSSSVIQQWCNVYGITMQGKRSLELDEDFFKDINTEEKAYWLGFFMADGSMNRECTKLTLNISVKDEYMLEILKKNVKTTSTIRYSTNNGFKYCRLVLYSQKMCKDLIYHGVVPKKSGKEILPDTVPKKMTRHFIRGFMDGDGSIVTYKKAKTLVKLDFAGMSYNIFYSIHNFLINEKLMPNDSKITLVHENQSRCFHLHYYSSNAMRILDYLYKDSTIYLERKYLKYKNNK